MRNRSKLYSRREPDKEGKLYFIFCEGAKRETTYFYFFNHIASQIIIQIVPLEDGKNSPMGLYNNACEKLLKTDENQNPEYSLNDGDEVWFIIDTDKWGESIIELRQEVSKKVNWHVAQSNPSFEVWLYYHFKDTKPQDEVGNWKDFLNQSIVGGFNSSKHPVNIQTAIINAENNYSKTNDLPDSITTEVFILAKDFLPLVKAEIDALLANEL